MNETECFLLEAGVPSQATAFSFLPEWSQVVSGGTPGGGFIPQTGSEHTLPDEAPVSLSFTLEVAFHYMFVKLEFK